MKKTRTIGIAVAALGIALCVSAFFLSDDFTPDLGLRWNLKNMQIVLKDEVRESFMDIAAFRERYSQYGDMDDQELALRLWTKYFSGMPEAEYRKVFLTSASARRTGAGSGDPLMIRWDMKDLRITDGLTREVMTADAIEFGLLKLTRTKVAFPSRWVLFVGLGLAVGGALFSLRKNKK